MKGEHVIHTRSVTLPIHSDPPRTLPYPTPTHGAHSVHLELSKSSPSPRSTASAVPAPPHRHHRHTAAGVYLFAFVNVLPTHTSKTKAMSYWYWVRKGKQVLQGSRFDLVKWRKGKGREGCEMGGGKGHPASPPVWGTIQHTTTHLSVNYSGWRKGWGETAAAVLRVGAAEYVKIGNGLTLMGCGWTWGGSGECKQSLNNTQ